MLDIYPSFADAVNCE